MVNSALEILIVPIFWTTLISCLAGAAIRTAMILVEAACSGVRRRLHASRAHRTLRRRKPPRIAGGLPSIG